MRAIDLCVEINGEIFNYKFLRMEGSDDDGAIYRLILYLNNGIQTVRDFHGTMEENARELSLYFRTQKNCNILELSGDIDLKRAFNFNQLDI